MSSVITINELQNVEAFAMKYIAQHLGLNIRPCKAYYVEEEGLWKVPLQAIVPRQVTKRDRDTKVFIYYLDDVGHCLFEKTDKTFTLTSPPSSGEIEREISQRFSNLTQRIEKEILKEGQMNWGKLNWIRTFMRPMYSIVINVLSRKKILISSLEKDHWKFARLLIDEKYIEMDKETSTYLRPTNELTGIWERFYGKEGSNIFAIAEHVIGKVFARRYEEIKTDLRIYPPAAYVDTTKVYYVDAIRFGENIPINENDLFLKYQKIGARILSFDSASFHFKTLVSELIAAELLDREGNYITGRQRIFDNLIKYRDEILQGAVESPGVVQIA